MNKLGIIMKEVYRKNVKSWSFFWMIFGPILSIVVIGLIIYFISQDEMGQSSGRLAVITDQPAMIQLVEEANEENEIISDLGLEEAKQAVIDKEIDGYLTLEASDKLMVKFYKATTGSNINLSKIQQALSAYQLSKVSKEIGLSQADIAKVEESSVNIETINISEDKDGTTKETSAEDPKVFVRMGVAYFVVFVVFMFIANYSSIISQEIATEKGSRIMEIILSSVDASTHFFGKMLGISFVVLTQLLVYGLIYLIIKLVFNQYDLFKELGMEGLDIGPLIASSREVIILGIVYAILGIIIFASLSGFLGSLVAKVEDVNKVVTPVMLTAVAGLYTGMFAMQSPNNIVVRVMSHIPLTTPFVMPFRISSETVSQLEITISILVSIIFSIFCLWLSAVLYKSNVLTYSDKGAINTLKRSFQMWKSEREAQQN